MKKKLKKLIAELRYWFKIIPEWNKCKFASCWDGNNASRRMMNILSPHFSEGKFNDYMMWMLVRGCNTAHVFLANKADGEGGGYNCMVDSGHAKVARKRIKELRLNGFAVVPWILADDSAAYAKDLFAHTDARIKFLADNGLLDHASFVVIGLEMNEGGSFPGGDAGWPKVAEALKKVYKGKLATHHTSGNTFKYAGLGDIVMGQLDPNNANAIAIKNQIAAIKKLGKKPFGFEYERKPNRSKAQAALDAGAYGVGNW